MDVGRPIAAPQEWCVELLGVDLATVRELAAKVEPYVRADGHRDLEPDVAGAADRALVMLKPLGLNCDGVLAKLSKCCGRILEN